jgi:hypothetical protein
MRNGAKVLESFVMIWLTINIVRIRICRIKEQIEINRRKLYEKFKTQFGLEKWMDYVPHVSLGYFGNEQKCKEAQSQVKTWNDIFTKQVDCDIHFSKISLYGFSDMETYFKAV